MYFSYKQNYVLNNPNAVKQCNKPYVFRNNQEAHKYAPSYNTSQNIKMNNSALMQPFIFVYLPLNPNILVNQLLQQQNYLNVPSPNNPTNR